jgi:hypothetical protein
MSKQQEKKLKAAEHNYVFDIKENILPVGNCKCGHTLFVYLKSSKENIPVYYCDRSPISKDDELCEPGDIREPKDGDTFFFPLQEIAKVLVDNYGPESKELFQ